MGRLKTPASPISVFIGIFQNPHPTTVSLSLGERFANGSLFLGLTAAAKFWWVGPWKRRRGFILFSPCTVASMERERKTTGCLVPGETIYPFSPVLATLARSAIGSQAAISLTSCYLVPFLSGDIQDWTLGPSAWIVLCIIELLFPFYHLVVHSSFWHWPIWWPLVSSHGE